MAEDKITSIFSKNKEGETLETPPEVADLARSQLETLIKSGIRSVVFIAEKIDGFDFCSAPTSMFTVIGAITSVYDLLQE